MSYSNGVLVKLLGSFGLSLLFASLLVLQLLDRLADDLHQVLLEGFFFEHKAVLVPDEIRHLGVPPVLFHASFEQPQNVLVVGVFSELQLAAVVHEFAELLGMALAQLVHSDFELLLLDVVVLLILRASGQTLPRETASQEVQQHVANCLEVVPPRLFVADVSVDTGVAGGACEVLALPERNVLAVGVLVTLGKTEINDVDVVLVGVIAADQEVVWLDVSVDDALFVDFLNSLDLLNGR